MVKIPPYFPPPPTIYLRVTIDGKRFEVATHQHTDPAKWSPTAGNVSGSSATAMHTNMTLDEMKRKVYEYKDRIQKEHRELVWSGSQYTNIIGSCSVEHS